MIQIQRPFCLIGWPIVSFIGPLPDSSDIVLTGRYRLVRVAHRTMLAAPATSRLQIGLRGCGFPRAGAGKILPRAALAVRGVETAGG